MKKYWMQGLLIMMMISVYGQDIVYGNFDGSNVHRVITPSGYLDIGPKNTSWAHIYTDRPRFIFNKPVYALNGVFGSYSNANLQLQTNGSTRMTILKSNGYVGIGTSNPVEELTIHHNDPTIALIRNDVNTIGRLSTAPHVVGISENLTVDYSLGFLLDDVNNPGWTVKLDAGNESHGDSFEVWRFPSGSSPQQFSNDLVKFKIDRDGNVGIGTTSPTEKLSVNGTIRSKEIVCEAAPWPDYVFEEDYDLKPLTEVENFIKAEGHLPNIPSAEEVEAGGIAIAKMNALLLEKVEELTLYLLEQNARIEKLESANLRLLDQLEK